MAYLDEHPNPYLSQQRPRRDTPSGLIVVHTAESMLDEIGEDTGAEGVADWMSRRTNYGSYHRLVDSDSIVAVVRFEMTAYGDGTGSNDFAIHVSFACRAADWPRMSEARKKAFIRNGAKAAAEAARWVEQEYGITVPAERISKAESDRRLPGFISHGERDPERRTDPGASFPWLMFLTEFENEMQEEDEMNKQQEEKLDLSIKLNRKILKRLNPGGWFRQTLNELGRDIESLEAGAKDDATKAQAKRLNNKLRRLEERLDQEAAEDAQEDES